MVTKYRLVYLGIAVGLMAFVALVSAETEPRRAPAFEALQRLHERLTEPAAGVEKGNLSEAGARELLREDQVDGVLAASEAQPVLLFKHSTASPESGSAYRHVRQWMQEHGDDAQPVYVVNVDARGPVSRVIEKRVAVEHASPQVILLDDSAAVWNASREGVTAEAIDAALVRLKRDTSQPLTNTFALVP